MFKKIFKWGFILACLCGILLAGALATLRFMYPPEKVKAMTLSYAKNKLHREISFDKISFNLIGVTLTNFALSEDSSFEQGTFIKANKLQAKLALLPLLKKRVEISTILLDGLDVNIIQQKDGTFNFDSLMSASSEESVDKPEETTEDSSLIAITAEDISITNCNLRYKNVGTGMTAGMDNLNISIDDFAMDKPFLAKINFTTQFQDATGPNVLVPIEIELNVFLADLQLQNAYALVNQLAATYKNMRFVLKGKVNNFNAPVVDLTGSLSGINNLTFVDFLPDLPNFTLPVIDLALKASLDLEQDSATISSAAMSVLSSALNAAGNVGWSGENVTYTFSGNLKADIAQLVKMTDSINFSPAGTISGKFKATDKKDGQDVSGTITLKQLRALYDPFTLSETDGTVQINSLQDIAISNLRGKLNGESFTASAAYKEIKGVMDIGWQLDLDKLTLSKFPSFEQVESTDSEQASATTTAASSSAEQPMNIRADIKVGEISVPYFRSNGFTANAALTNVTDTMTKANGTVSFSLQPGAITNLDSFVKQSKTARLILLPLKIINSVAGKLNINLFEASANARKGEISFTSGEGLYTFTNGKMNITKTSFISDLTNLNGSGSLDFDTSALDMKVSATLITKQTPVVIKIGGTLDNPTGKLDVLNTVGSVVSGILSVKTAKSAAKGTASTAGNVASGAAKTTGKVASTAANDTAKAAKATVKALGNLFKKTPEEDSTNQ